MINELDQQIILGALDTLGTALADHEHEWTEGERAIYEQAVECVRRMGAQQVSIRSTDWLGWFQGWFLWPRRVTYDGKPVNWMWNLFGCRRWVVSWHPHNKTCRYGFYHNKGGTIGLKAALNVPLLGDFSVWLSWVKPA